jgi:hypothetical protein
MTGAGKVITLFKQLDEDRDGSVSKAEFRSALPLLGYDGSNTDAIDSVFDELDLDGSGEIRYDELKALLTVDRLADRGMELAAVLQDGALGEITATAKNRHSLRHGDVRERRKAEEVEEAEAAAEAKVARKAVAAEAEAARAANEAQALRREEEARAAAAAGEGHVGGRVFVACEVEDHAYARLRFEWQELGVALMQTTDCAALWRGVAIELTISTRAPIACLDLVML